MNNSANPYKSLTSYLNKNFPFRVQKISINAGFTCPNRDGSKGRGGCTYCNNGSFSPDYSTKIKPVSEQLKEGIDFFSHKYKEMKYLAYFQSYTSTYENTDKLIAMYEEALAYPNVVGLVVSTRPDCMPDELLNYFEKINKHHFVLIEYGVESTIDSTLERVNRQHSFSESKDAILKTANRGIPVGAHMILGLPGESRNDIISHATTLSRLPLTTIKLHQLQIVKGTVLAREYTQDPSAFNIFELEEYINLCVDFSELLNPSFYIDRFASQSPKDMLIAPDWGIKNHVLTQKIIKRFKERKTFQGRLYKETN